MKQAYDLMALAEKLQARGLQNAEKMAADVYVDLKAWLQESAKLSENPYDDIAMPFLKQLDPVIMPQIDKINGKIGA
jgi:hypothetical protein